MSPRAARVLAAAAAGALLAASRPPLDAGGLAIVALVPLFVAWRGGGVRRSAGLAFVAGVVHHALLVSWAWYFGAVALMPFVVVLALYWLGIGAVVGLLAHLGLRSPWLTAAVWVLGEAVVARFPLGGFSWGEVGYAFHALAPARDVAGVGGVALVSFLAVAANALVADLVTCGRAGARRALLGLVIVGVIAGPVAAAAPRPEPGPALRVAVLQGNDLNRDLTPAEVRARYLPESHFGLAARLDEPVDLVIFPESSMDEDPRTDPELGRRLADVARSQDAWVLANAVADGPDPDRDVWNLNVMYGPEGKVTGTYAKRHLVPFGEYVPVPALREVIPVLDEEIPRDHLPGIDPGLFAVRDVTVATVICFESAFAHEIRPLVRDGADVLVVSTNNRSYRRSANSEQHLAIGRMRAAETGRPLVHAAISGISAFVDADGRVTGRTELFERTVTTATVQSTTGQTLYVRYGEWGPLLALAAIAGALAAGVVRHRRRFVDSGEPAGAPRHDAPALSSTGDRA